MTLPTATLLAAALAAPAVGQGFYFTVKNTGDTTLTVAVGTGGTGNGTLTIATVTSRLFFLRWTGVQSDAVVGSTNTYTLYSIGTLTA